VEGAEEYESYTKKEEEKEDKKKGFKSWFGL